MSVADPPVAGTGRQVVHVAVRGGYRPARIEARAGVPLRLVFDRRESDACSERVVFSSPRLERRLGRGKTIIDLPAQPAGVVRFTCSLGRYRGTIRLSDRSPSRMRAWLTRVEARLALGLALWVCLLPLIVLLSALLLGASLSLPLLAAAALIVLGGCLLAVWRSDAGLAPRGTERP
jgi:hypothetical protein